MLPSVTVRLTYEVWSPDDFFQLIHDSDSQLVRQVTEIQMAYWVRRKGKALTCRSS